MTRRFVTLDAMRGVAALIVVWYHSFPLSDASCSVAKNVCVGSYGYLAVDLFFALSGFVLSLGFDDKLRDGMTAIQFMYARACRMMPLYWVGLAMGLAAHMYANESYILSIAEFKGLVLNLAIMPALPHWYFREIFPYDPPGWSLFFELWVANLLFGVFHRFLKGRALIAIVVLSGVMTAGLGFANETIHTGFFWSNVFSGFPRVVFSFFAGVALQRARPLLPKFHIPAIFVLGSLIALLLVQVPDVDRVYYELFCICLAFPTLILFGAEAIEKRARVGKLIGEASYGVYTVHSRYLPSLAT